MRVQSEQDAPAAIRLEPEPSASSAPVRVIYVCWKQRERFKVGLLLLAVRIEIGKRAVKQPDQG